MTEPKITKTKRGWRVGATMRVTLSEATLKRKLWLTAAIECLSDYRSPAAAVTLRDVNGLSEYLDAGYTPADAAECYQARFNDHANTKSD